MNWNILYKAKIQNLHEIEKVLLKNRDLKTKKEIDEFLNPKLESVFADKVGIDKKELKRAIDRIARAIKNKEKIVVYGDYDVDGICGTAILWEVLNGLGADVMPYIPHRIDEGYGLSKAGIKNLEFRIKNVKLIITVDNGIVANEAIKFANKEGIDVIVTDHHVPSGKLPDAFAIVHTTAVCGTSVAWILSKNVILSKAKNLDPSATPQDDNEHLALVALATVADLVPLTGTNRILLKAGLEALNKTERIGLLAIFKESGIIKGKIGVYEIGHIIAPRLNATGRIEHAIDSLRLICTKDSVRAEKLAGHLAETNKNRQGLTEEARLHAVSQVLAGERSKAKLLFVAHETYEPGVVGLVAGRLVEEFYRPSIVVSVGKEFSRASARSVRGFNVIEFLRSASEFLEDVGGHPMAAGFTVKTEKIPVLKKKLEELAEELVNEDSILRNLRIDCEISPELIGFELLTVIGKFEPFGMKNPVPTFISRNIQVLEKRLVGKEQKHLKLRLKYPRQGIIDAIGFGMAESSSKIKIGQAIDLVYSVEKEEWNGNTKLQFKIKDLKPLA